MKRFFKKSLAVFLAVLMLLSVVPTMSITVAAADELQAGDTLKVNRTNSARVGYDAPGYKTSVDADEGMADYYFHIAQFVLISGASVVNMRSGPGTSYDVIGLLVSGDKCIYIDQTTDSSGNKWYKVEWEQESARTNSSGKKFPAGTYIGWVSSTYGSYSKKLGTRYRYEYETTTGLPVYCVEYCKSWNSATYTGTSIEEHPVWQALTDEAQTGIMLATIYGYPHYNYGVADCDAYAATQAIIWEFQMGYRTIDGGLNNTSIYYPNSTIAGIKGKPAETAYNAIVEAIEKHYTIPSFMKASKAAANNNPIALSYNSTTGKWTTTITDTNGVLEDYNLVSKDDNVTITTDGNEITITATSVSANATMITVTRDLPESTQSLLVMDNNSDGQTCIVGSMDDPVPAYMTLSIEASEGYLKINKTNEAGTVVGNATYGVYSDSACTVELATITTDSSGTGTAALDVSAGTTVYVKEKSLGTEEAKVYEVDSTVYSAIINPGATSVVSVIDEWKPATFSLTKKDSTGNTISGVTFTAYSDSACTSVLKDVDGNDVVVTTSGGTATSTAIDVGTTGTKTIYLKETAMDATTSSKYQLDSDTVYKVVLNAGQDTEVNNGEAIINDWIPAQLDLVKKDSLGNLLSGVTFRVYDDVACTTRTTDVDGNAITMTTDSNGYAISPEIDITNADGSRTVYVKEYSLSSELSSTHTMSSTVYTVDLTTGKTTSIGDVTNAVKNAQFTLTKEDDTGNKLEGVKFTAYTDEACTSVLKDVNGNDVVVTTDASGVATSAEIEILDTNLTRTVYVKETYLPQSDTHTMSTTVYTVALTAGGTAEVNDGNPIINKWLPAKFSLIKEDSTGHKLEGVEFTAYTDEACTTVLKDTDGNDVVLTTDANGAAESESITVAGADDTLTVYVKETAMPDSLKSTHVMDSTVYEVVLLPAQTVKVNNGDAIVNEWAPGKFSIVKKDNTGNALEGVKFTAYADEACTTVLTDTDGNNVVLTTDANGAATSADVAVDEGIHDSNGKRTVWLKETSLPSSLESTHYMNTEVFEITVNSGTTTAYGSDIINEWKPAKVSIVKGDDTGNLLAGVQFTAYDDEACTTPVKDVDGNIVVLTTDENGYAVSGNIDVTEGVCTANGTRTIYLKETFMPIELSFTHIMNETPMEVVLSASKTTSANNGSTVINYWKPAKFELTKYDETENRLEGATFTAYTDAACTTVLTDKDGAEVVLTTDKNGYAVSSDIKLLSADGKRTVYIKETAQSDELASTHKMNDNVFTVVLSAGETTTVDELTTDNVVGIINEWKDGSFYLVKKDSDGNLMSGVVFDVYTDSACTTVLKDVDGNNVVLTTDENGEAQSENIEILDASGTRTVYIKERSVPSYTDKVISVSTAVYTAVVKAGENVKANDGADIINTITERKAKFGLKKENENGDKLEGIEFTAYTDESCTTIAKDINGNDVVITTDSNGYAQSNYIAYPAEQSSQRLYIKETAVPDNLQKLYKTNNTVYTVDIVAGEIAIANDNSAIINEWKDASLSLHKIDSWYNEPVEGAVFTVYGDSACSSVIGTLTTDKDGNASLSDIPVDDNGFKTVYVKETQVSDEDIYESNGTVFTVVLNAGENTEVNDGEDVVNDKIKHKVKFMKIDSETGAALAGYTVEVYDSKLGKITTLTTDDTGYTSAAELPVGSYTYKEIAAPDGYLIDDSTYSFTINNDGTVTGSVVLATDGITISNGTVSAPATVYVADAPIVVTLNKTDDTQPDTPVEGAEIKITQVSATILDLTNADPAELLSNNSTANPYTDTQYTDANGDVTFTRMPAGTYVYQETKAAPGYHKTDVVYAFAVSANGNVVTGTTEFTNTPVETVISKTDLCTGEPVPGAEIAIYDEDGNEVWREATDEDGTITALALKPGKYTFEETVNPDGYKLNTNTFEFVIGEDSTVISGVTDFTDEPTEVVISKKDATTAEGVPGAQITILDENNVIVRTETTDNDGNAKFQYLAPGDYTFVETEAPEGYIINETVFNFTINADGSVTGDNTVTNEQNEVTLRKSDAGTGELLAGAKIEIYDENNNLYDTVTTGADGTVTIKKIPVGTYTFMEIEAPTGYSLNTTVFEFSIDGHGVVTGTTTITNNQTQVTITKYDLDTNEPLSDADIAIYDENGKEVARGTTEGNEGSFTVYKLVPGTYTFKELSAPEGYAKNPGTYTFVLDEYGNVSGATFLVNKPTEVTINKIDKKTGDVLAGAVIGIYDSDNNLVAEETTDSEGNITVTHLPVGTYTYKELKAPEGYALNTKTFKFTIDEYGNVTGDATLENSPTEVTINKSDITNTKPVPGAVIVIYDANGNEVFRDITAADGTITAFYLPIGSYTFEETVAPSTYKLNTNTFEFTINEDGTITGTTDFTNEPTEVTISKTDLTTGEPVPGATITIYNENCEKVYEDVTDENGTITAFYLPHGTYTFKETLAPSTYKLNPNTFTFTINSDGTVIGTTEFTDEPTEVVISKTDLTTSAPVADAEITIYDAEGNEVFKDVTDKDGTVTATYLPHGKYTFKETVAASTYKLNTNTFEFTINADGSVTGTTEFTDEPTKVTITKTDLCTSEPVPGAEITIYDADGNEVFSNVTDENGTITAFYLPHGTYTFKETLAPSTYKLNPDTFEFTINEDGSVSGVTDFTDEPTEVTITKIASDTDLPLSGSDIIIYNSENKVVYDGAVDGATDENGEITLTYLPHGTYTYEECWAPTGYYINPTIFEFTIDETGAVSGQTTFRNNPTEVTITKVDIVDSQPVPGATITIYNEFGEIVFEEVTGNDGTVTAFHLPVGTYKFMETVAPSEYKLNCYEFSFTIDEYGVVTGDTVITDEPTEVTFTKVDAETNEVLSGAEITIYDESGTDVVTLTTGADGKATYLYLPHGNYTFVETKAPEGYVLNERQYSFRIDDNGVFFGSDTIPNTKIYGEIEIGKADAEDDELMLPNAVFDIMNSEGEVIATVTTDENGIARAEYIEYGNYTIVEKTAPEGYNINATAYPVSIVYDGDTVRVDVRDSVIKGRIEIAKKNAATHEPVANAEFEVIDSAGNVVETIVTDVNGIATTSLLRYGNYILHESKAPANYIAGEDVDFAITEEGTVVQITYYENPIVKTGAVATDNTAMNYLLIAGLMLLFAAGGLVVYAVVNRKRDEDAE